MFGIGPQELLIIGLLFLVVFGPKKLPGMARDFGRFVNGAHRTAEEFKSELVTEEVKEVRHAVEELKDKTRHSVGELKTEVASGEEGDEPASDSSPGDEDQARKPKEKKEPPRKGEASPATTTPTQAQEEKQPNASSGESSPNGLQFDTRSGGHKRTRTRWRRIFGGKYQA